MQEKEYSYIDILMRLKGEVTDDIIPENEKAEINCLIEQLQSMLWKYSY